MLSLSHSGRSTTRRAALALTASVTVGAFVLSASPVGAATPPEWPTAGRLPIGCDPGVVYTNVTATTWTYQFSDSTVAALSNPRIATGAGNISVLPVAGANVYARVTLSDPCSGVGGGVVDWARNGAILGGNFLTPRTTDSFSGAWATLVGNLKPDSAGVWTIPVAATAHRYDTITLDQDFKLVSKTAGSSTVTIVGPWAKAKSYLLRQTTLTITAPTSVKKGKLATVSGVLKYATNAGLVADGGEKVIVQTRIGTATWKNITVVAANAAGVVTAKLKLTKSSQVRFVHAAVLSGRFTAASVSAIKTIKVI